jgi:hypothetical protein
MSDQTEMARADQNGMTHFAWAVLGQLARGSVWDGDLVCKSGRDELVRLGLARRERKDSQGLMINELTQPGMEIAAHLDAQSRAHA